MRDHVELLLHGPVMARFDSLRSDERGVAMVMALAVLAVLLLLSTVAVIAALQLSQSATRQRSEAAALAAAQAGLDVATYRLNHTPDDRVARTLSAWTVTSNASIAILTGVWGVLAQLTGLRTTSTY